MHHPWRELRDRGDDVRVHYTTFADGQIAATEGNLIWLEAHLKQVERRCAVQHEQIHMDRGHCDHNDIKEERIVRRLTAQRLIDTADLIDGCKWAMSVEELADYLWVTTDVLMDRLRGLSAAERAMIACAVETSWHQESP